MVNKIYNINLDLRRVTAQAESIPPVVDGDNGNIFVITLTDDGAPVNLSGCKVVCAFSKTDGSTVEQDTEDANVALDDYGITAVGTPDEEDTITITSTGTAASAAVSGTGISSAAVDTEKFLGKFPDAGEYEFVYFGTSWMYGMHSVVIGGTSHNVLTVFLKTGSFGVGKNNCELQIYTGTVLVTTAQFNFDGRKGILNDETIQSEDKYPILVSLIADATNALNYARPFGHPSATLEQLDPDEDAYVNFVEGDDSVEFQFGIPKAEGDLSSGTPEALGIADAGDSLLASRSDHVHPMPSAADVGAVPTTRKINNKGLDSDITLEADDIGTDTVGVTVQDVIDAAANAVLYLTSISCSALTGDFATVSNNAITADHVVAEITFSAPNNVRSDVTWTTASGSLILNGTCHVATTANIVLIKKDN